MNRLAYIATLLLTVFVSASAFAPSTSLNVVKGIVTTSVPKTTVNMGFGLDEEPKKLTRENEPDEYFSSKMDEMSDEEKIPIALAGLAFISLPFIAGLIALYSAK